MRKIAALVPYALRCAPSQRVRIEAWAPHLAAHGWRVEFLPFESEALRAVIYEPGHYLEKAWQMSRCYARQLGRLLRGTDADVLFISREAALIGPAVLERLAARLGPPLVYDIDDPVFLPYESPANRKFSLLKFSRKTDALLRLADHVLCVNDRIAEYARRFARDVSVIPNSVDIENYRPPMTAPQLPLRLAWIGSYSTLPNLRAIIKPLQRLQARYHVRVRIIGPENMDCSGLDAEVKAWSADTEVTDLQGCHVGLVPLVSHPWNEWKFFFKTIQYMGVGLPVVAANEGSNQDVIVDGVNGFLVRSEHEWYERLALLCESGDLRERMGEAARRTVVNHYSLQVQAPRFAVAIQATLASVGKSR